MRQKFKLRHSGTRAAYFCIESEEALDMTRRFLFICAIVSLLRVTGQAQESNLPPISWTCPMHPDVIEGKKGQCPICAMNLVPIRLDYVWSCPVHSAVEEDH